jgi:nucleotide-binding universal stress UspA family protein
MIRLACNRVSDMHVLVATDGTLDITRTAQIAGRLAGQTGRVTVFTAVEVPRQILSDLRSASTRHADPATLDVAFRREQAGDLATGHWIGDDAFVAQYVKRVVSTRTTDLVAALQADGVDVVAIGVEGESASRSVLEAVGEHQPDVLCVGTHGQGRFEGLLGSLSTKLARLAPCSVFLIR